jgi:SAM-dependent methyltransferase
MNSDGFKEKNFWEKNIVQKDPLVLDEFLGNPQYLSYRQVVLDMSFKFWDAIIGSAKGRKLLDCGCGYGVWPIYWSKKGFDVHCLDYVLSGISVVKRSFAVNGIKETKLIVGDMRGLPIKDNSFDVVLCISVLELFENIDIPIQEIARVLKKGGIICAQIYPLRFSMMTLPSVVWRMLQFKFKEAIAIRKGVVVNFDRNSFSLDEYRKAFVRAGLTKVRITGAQPFPPLPLTGYYQKLYGALIKLSEPFYRWFDNSNLKITDKLGCGYYAYAIKE